MNAREICGLSEGESGKYPRKVWSIFPNGPKLHPPTDFFHFFDFFRPTFWHPPRFFPYFAFFPRDILTPTPTIPNLLDSSFFFQYVPVCSAFITGVVWWCVVTLCFICMLETRVHITLIPWGLIFIPFKHPWHSKKNHNYMILWPRWYHNISEHMLDKSFTTIQGDSCTIK